MGPKKTNRIKTIAISKHQGKTPDHIPGSMTSKHVKPKNQQGVGNALPGHPQNYMTLLLVTLLVLCIWVSPSAAEIFTVETSDCAGCHSPEAWEQIHQYVPHTAAPLASQVVLFADDAHDDAGWYGSKPYFAVSVDCITCHISHLPTIHGNDCSICHPTPFDTLGNNWFGGCQQGGCHQVYHEDSITAHLPWEDVSDPDNNCSLCHYIPTNEVLQSNCLNCHAEYGVGAGTPPITTSNALATYIGPAKIDFSITNGNGDVVIGTTFQRLDVVTEGSGKNIFVSTPGEHELFFWSKDQSGNVETSTKMAFFAIVTDTTPPATISNAKSIYYQGAKITLTATDNSTLGVKNTYFRINGGPVKTGSIVNIPATQGTIVYTLNFWSEDWSGNIETQHSVTFTVKSGTATLHLAWGDCDIYPENVPTGNDSANWTVRRGGWTGTLVASGSGSASAGWDGIDDIPVPVSATPYFVRIDWEWQDELGQTDFPNISVTTPGQLIRLSY